MTQFCLLSREQDCFPLEDVRNKSHFPPWKGCLVEPGQLKQRTH